MGKDDVSEEDMKKINDILKNSRMFDEKEKTDSPLGPVKKKEEKPINKVKVDPDEKTVSSAPAKLETYDAGEKKDAPKPEEKKESPEPEAKDEKKSEAKPAEGDKKPEEKKEGDKPAEKLDLKHVKTVLIVIGVILILALLVSSILRWTGVTGNAVDDTPLETEIVEEEPEELEAVEEEEVKEKKSFADRFLGGVKFKEDKLEPEAEAVEEEEDHGAEEFEEDSHEDDTEEGPAEEDIEEEKKGLFTSIIGGIKFEEPAEPEIVRKEIDGCSCECVVGSGPESEDTEAEEEPEDKDLEEETSDKEESKEDSIADEVKDYFKSLI